MIRGTDIFYQGQNTLCYLQEGLVLASAPIPPIRDFFIMGRNILFMILSGAYFSNTLFYSSFYLSIYLSIYPRIQSQMRKKRKRRRKKMERKMAKMGRKIAKMVKIRRKAKRQRMKRKSRSI